MWQPVHIMFTVQPVACLDACLALSSQVLINFSTPSLPPTLSTICLFFLSDRGGGGCVCLPLHQHNLCHVQSLPVGQQHSTVVRGGVLCFCLFSVVSVLLFPFLVSGRCVLLANNWSLFIILALGTQAISVIHVLPSTLPRKQNTCDYYLLTVGKWS